VKRFVLPILANLMLGLWLGGLVMLFVSVSSLFQTFPDRHTAGLGATTVFHRFEMMQGVLAICSLPLTWFALPVRRMRTVAFVLLVVAVILAAVITFVLSAMINDMRLAGTTDTPRFYAIHGAAMGTYLVVTALVTAAWITVLAALRAETSATVSPGPVSPGVPVDSA
jgi:hypothetical protein